MAGLDSSTYKNFFVLNEKLYYKVSQDKSRNVLRAKDCVTRKMHMFPFTEVDQRAQRVFDKADLRKLINRGERILEYNVKDGNIPEPYMEVSSDGKVRRVFWSEAQVFDIWEYFMETTTRRSDGSLVHPLPSRKELRSQMRSGRMLYVKEDGEYVPIWKADNLYTSNED